MHPTDDMDEDVMNGGIRGASPRQRHRLRQRCAAANDTNRTKPPPPGRSVSEGSPPKIPPSLRRHRSVRLRSKACDQAGMDDSTNSASSVDDMRNWRSSSSSLNISIKDIMGGEKNATEVEKIHTVHSRGREETAPQRRNHGKTSGSDFRGGAEAKIQNIMKARRVKQGRRSDVKNSLSSFLQATAPATGDEDEGGEDEEEEEFVEEVGDESIISDEEEAKKARDTTRLRIRRKEIHNDDKSVKSTLSKNQSTRRLGRTTRTVDGGGNNNSSSHSRKGGVQRRRTRDLDDLSVGASSRRHSRRSMSRPRPSGEEVDGNKSDNGSTRRTRTRILRDARSVDAGASSRRDARSVDGSSSRRRRSLSRGADSVQAGPGPGPAGGGRGRRSMSIGRDDDDKSVGERSVGSRKSTTASNRRGRRPSKPRHPKPSHNRMPIPAQYNPTSDDRDNLQQPPCGPPSPLPSPEATSKYISGSTPTLSNHIESNHEQEEKKMDFEEASEESSRFSAGNTAQSVLLQFDPTNAGNVRTLNQSTARKTSETIRHADGTESELQISELPGLPTFENQPGVRVVGDHRVNLGLSTECKYSSSRSLSSVDGGSSVEGLQKPSSFQSAGGSPPSSSRNSQNPGEAPAESALGKPPRAKVAPAHPRQRPNMQATKSFMQRMQRSIVANGNGEELNLFSGFMNRSTRNIGHQALSDDDNSEED